MEGWEGWRGEEVEPERWGCGRRLGFPPAGFAHLGG